MPNLTKEEMLAMCFASIVDQEAHELGVSPEYAIGMENMGPQHADLVLRYVKHYRLGATLLPFYALHRVALTDPLPEGSVSSMVTEAPEGSGRIHEVVCFVPIFQGRT